MVVGLVGCGAWGQFILRDLVSLGCEVRVVARSPESIARALDGGAVAVLADGWDHHVSIFRSSAQVATQEGVETPGELPLLAELRALVEHQFGGAPPRSSAAEGAATVAAIAELRALADVA